MAWMNWRPEIPDPKTEWEEFDRRMDEQKDEAVLRQYGWRERPSPPPRTTERKENHAKLVCQ